MRCNRIWHLIRVFNVCPSSTSGRKKMELFKIHDKCSNLHHSSGKISKGQIDAFFFLFFPGNRIWHSMQTVSTYEPVHDKTYNKTCATSEVSDQTAHMCSLCWSYVLSTASWQSMRDKQEVLPYLVDVQADLSICWSHRSYCRFCHGLAHISKCCLLKILPRVLSIKELRCPNT